MLTGSDRCRSLLALCALAIGCSDGSPPRGAHEPTVVSTVATRSGELSGICEDGVCAYLGVRYAFAPIGNRRWQAPLGYGADGAAMADRFGPSCPQVSPAAGYEGSEDCLTLNLWVPADADDLPTLVFFHGGGNVGDSASNPRYDGRRLAKSAGIIVASVEYRLGALGYLVHPALGAENQARVSGNYGLLDQGAALDWLREHTRQFGGNYRFTVMGQSAGARNLCSLLASPLPLLLGVRGAILQSGACNARTRAQAEAQGQRLVQALQCGSADVAACLRDRDAAEVTRALPGWPDPMTTSPYNTSVDGWLLDGPPLEGLGSGRNLQIALWVGSNGHEVAHAIPPVDSEATYRALVRSYFGKELVDAVLGVYPASAYASPAAALVAAITDARYTCAMRQTLRARLQGGAEEVYRYVFAHSPQSEPYAAWGAIHGLELMYLFQNFEAYGYVPTAPDRELSQTLARYYSDFVHHGTLAPEGLPPWPRYSMTTPAFLSFGQSRQGDRAETHCDFWDALASSGTD